MSKGGKVILMSRLCACDSIMAWHSSMTSAIDKGSGESDCFPFPPRNYFSNEAQAALDALRQSADCLDRPRLARMLSQIVESDAPAPTWADDAERLYRNWLERVAFEKIREARADATA